MAEITRWLFVFSALTVGLVGSHKGIPFASAQTVALENEVRVVTSDELPWDATMVVAASVLTMRGRDRSENLKRVVLAPAAKVALSDPAFRYQDFSLTGFALTEYRVSTVFADAVAMSAILTFVDTGGRRAATSLVTDYVAATPGLEIKAAKVAILPPPNPEVRLFIVPARDVPDSLFAANVGQLDLLRHVAAKALTHEAAKRLPKSPENLYVFAFFQDRLPPDAEVQLRVSETPEGIGGDPNLSATVDFDGWRVATMRAKFALNSGTEFFIKAIYRPGSPLPAAERTPRLVGSLSSHLK